MTSADATDGASDPADTPQALSWLQDEDVVDKGTGGEFTASPVQPAVASLVPESMVRRAWRSAALLPLAIVVLVAAAYGTAMAVWPLTAIPPTISAVAVTPKAAPAAKMAWPKAGSAAVGVTGIGGPVASTDEQTTIASITKVVTALMVMDESPVTAKDQGPDYAFTQADSADYWQYLRRNESALDVPAGGSLTQYQVMQGMLIGSANNYAARLAETFWPTDQTYAAAAADWLHAHDLDGITLTNPTGIDYGNVATPAALIALADVALANPTIADIVSTRSVVLPGAGTVTNTNQLLKDKNVVGVKTGTLEGHNLLVSKNITVGNTHARIDAVTLNQPTEALCWSTAKDLLSQVQKQVKPVTAVKAGTTVGHVTTAWGDDVRVATASDATVALWNKAKATVDTTFTLGDKRRAGSRVGTLKAAGPIDEATVPVTLTADVAGPDFWWRVTHPLELLGLEQ